MKYMIQFKNHKEKQPISNQAKTLTFILSN